MRAKHLWVCMMALAVAAAIAAAGPQKNLAPNGSDDSPAGAVRNSSAPRGTVLSSSGPASSPGPTEGSAAKAAPPARSLGSNSEERPADDTRLPVRRVVLYKSGVGYFEHLGQVHGDQSVRIDFTSGQLNDVLQSLTVLDLNGGRIDGVSYNSEAPFAQRLGALRLPLDEKTDLAQFYGALRGARLEVHSGTTTITGRLLSIERKTRSASAAGDATTEVDLATLVSDTGEVRSVELTPAVSVRLADGDVNQEVSRYLALLGSARQQDLRRMNISTSGAGERQLYVSYVSEVPIWKTTYRFVLPSKKGEEPLLQGWAIVDNTVGEDWNDVELSLVAGAPQSFIQQLSQPYYARRPVVPLPESVQLTPQTHASAMSTGLGKLSGDITDPSGADVPSAQVSLVDPSGRTIATTFTDSEGHYEFAAVPPGNYSVLVAKGGFAQTRINSLPVSADNEMEKDVALQIGASAQTVEIEETSAALMMMPPAKPSKSLARISGGAVGALNIDSSSVGAAREMQTAAASGAELGDLFEYKLKDRVTIQKNESALVPIVQSHVKAEKVSLWNTALNSERPLRALWLTNSTDLTLDGGSFTVLEDEAYSGEGLTEAVKPGERRLLSYAADLGVRVHQQVTGGPVHVVRVHVREGSLRFDNESWQATQYVVQTDDTNARSVVIEHPIRSGWSLAKETPKPEETTATAYRFLVPVDAHSPATLGVRETVVNSTYYQLNQITYDQIKFFLQQGSITPEIEAALRKILAKKDEVAALGLEIAHREAERKKIFDDQARLRENLKALKGSAEERALTQRYTQQLNDEETRLDALNKEYADLEAKQMQMQAELDHMIQTLAFDVKI